LGVVLHDWLSRMIRTPALGMHTLTKTGVMEG
jgi:hypothetical protein